MKSSLEKAVVPKVESTKAAEAAKAERKRKEEADFRALLPQTREERAKIVYPSITDGDDWKYYFSAGHWCLKFKVSGVTFEIHDEYIPADSGTPTEGYMGTDAHWSPALFVIPENEYEHRLGSIGDVDDSFLASLKRTDKDAKKGGHDNAQTRKWLAEEVKKVNDEIAKYVEYYLLHKDDSQYRQRLRNENRRGW